MKIFNWVHRRFCYNFNSSNVSLHEDGLPRNSSIKAEPKHQKDPETQALLDDSILLVDMPENWKLDGILSIGTLAVDAFETPEHQNEFNIREVDHNGKNECHEEKHYCNYDDGGGDGSACSPGELSSILEGDIGLFKLYRQDQRETLKYIEIKTVDDAITDSDDEAKGKEKKNDGKRVTLAELFLADPDVETKADVKAIYAKKATVFCAKGLSKSKKLLPDAKEDSRPLKKLHQFMRRMTKRKIHPELGESKSQKRENQMMKWSNNNHEQDGGTETVSLLQT
ncbi:hypothetical protein Ancab_036747 [Ancistrocladus abbreviatus]